MQDPVHYFGFGVVDRPILQTLVRVEVVPEPGAGRLDRHLRALCRRQPVGIGRRDRHRRRSFRHRRHRQVAALETRRDHRRVARLRRVRQLISVGIAEEGGHVQRRRLAGRHRPRGNRPHRFGCLVRRLDRDLRALRGAQAVGVRRSHRHHRRTRRHGLDRQIAAGDRDGDHGGVRRCGSVRQRPSIRIVEERRYVHRDRPSRRHHLGRYRAHGHRGHRRGRRRWRWRKRRVRRPIATARDDPDESRQSDGGGQYVSQGSSFEHGGYCLLSLPPAGVNFPFPCTFTGASGRPGYRRIDTRSIVPSCSGPVRRPNAFSIPMVRDGPTFTLHPRRYARASSPASATMA